MVFTTIILGLIVEKHLEIQSMILAATHINIAKLKQNILLKNVNSSGISLTSIM